ncbi:MAG TPA: CocE/NonD family hydrolase, partial [Solirubrobacteraceae bacterium]|nr:CocE/NonD family hydrolase [Solirubrobacteraceae bacterium]
AATGAHAVAARLPLDPDSMGRSFHMRRVVVAVTLIAAFAVPSSAAAAPRPFGHDCRPENGVRFCPTVGLDDRVRSFDGAPLDVDVTLPRTGNGPFPTVVMMHGYGGDKDDFEQSRPEGEDPSNETLYHWNNNFFAKQGYAVVNYSARGFGRSCGERGNPDSPPCSTNRSYVHLADQRWEARDTQHLLGKLADQGVTRPRDIGVTGISYGGGQSLELAYLRDRIRRIDDSFAPWRSPKGKRMEIAAAFPRWLWSDLVYSLLPNGRFRDDRRPREGDSRNPLGIEKASYVTGLFAAGDATGTYCGEQPTFFPCDDFSANLTRFFARTSRGEPPDREARRIADEIFNHHQGYGLGGVPAPLLLQDGFTDDLFPVVESLRVYNQQRARDSGAQVSLQFGDLGHPRGSNKKNTDRFFNDQGARFLAFHLKDGSSRGVPKPGAVTTFTQTCPQDAPADGPYQARSWNRIHPGAIRFSGGASQVVTAPANGDPYGTAVDPISGGGDACRSVPKLRAAGTAVYVGPRSKGYTMMGLPKVTAEIETTGLYGELNSRLWDVSPDGSQRLVSRGAYRLRNNQSGSVTFQLFGNGYRFAPGHRPKLELLGKDEPFLRPSNFGFEVLVKSARVELPTLERSPQQGDGRGSAAGGRGCTQRGTERGEVIRGTPNSDVICAGGGNDLVYGLGGDDVLIGGGGNDVLRGDAGDDDLDGGSGNDQLIGGYGDDSAEGGSGNDGHSGQAGSDSLDSRDGVEGNDTVNGGTGSDSCRADRGDARSGCE